MNNLISKISFYCFLIAAIIELSSAIFINHEYSDKSSQSFHHLSAENADNLLMSITLHVDSSVVASGDGSSWNQAFKYLNDALDIANLGGEYTILVAKGTYYPDERTNSNTDNRNESFEIN
ncbi:MAG TPA: hypothetical protein PKD85_23915, partial [Saprospiraceae bacterium]|nr:hypothetical protein [Saprospiraceae bacterium]